MSKKNQKQAPLSPKKYIMTRARTLPIDRCVVNDNWEETGLASLIVARKHSNGNMTGAGFVIDFMDFGLKDSYEFFNIPEHDFIEMLGKLYDEEAEPMDISYELAHNMVYGGIEFAEDQGFDGKKKAGLTLYIMEEDSDEIEYIDLPFGSEEFDELDWDEETEDQLFFEMFEQDDWKEYFENNPEFSFDSQRDLTISLFAYLYEKEHPEIKTNPFEVGDLPINFDSNEEHNKNKHLINDYVRIQQSIVMADKEDLSEEIEKIKNYISKYPDNPIFYNFLTQAYQFAGDDIHFEKSIVETVAKFPDYMIGRIVLGNNLIDNDRLEEFEKLFPAPYTPMAAFPPKKEFHFTEIVPFLGTLMRYFVRKDDLINAFRFEEMVYGGYLTYPEMDDLPASNVFQVATEEFFEKKAQYCKENWRRIFVMQD